jgi:prepilin-type processing-associated H-X9-DG protein
MDGFLSTKYDDGWTVDSAYAIGWVAITTSLDKGYWHQKSSNILFGDLHVENMTANAIINNKNLTVPK